MIFDTTQILHKGITRLLPLAALILWVGCSEHNDSKKEGVITYNIEYLDEVRTNPLIGMLPSKMNVIFRPGKTKTNIEGMWGFFNFMYIADTKTGVNQTLLRLVDKKYNYIAREGNIAYGYDNMRNFKTELSSDTKTILGYECNKGLAYSSSFEPNPQPFFYTTDINIFAPNINNPYSEIPGVLLEFQVELNGIHMKMTASSVVYKTVPKKVFEIPEGYSKVTKSEIHKVLEPYFSTSRPLSKIPMKR